MKKTKNKLDISTKSGRISEILRLLYTGKVLTVKTVCREIFGPNFKQNELRLIQQDFKFLLDDTGVPIEPFYEKEESDNSGNKYFISDDHLKTGLKKVGEKEIFATLIQKKFNQIFKNTGFQEVFDNTYNVIQDFYSADLEDKFTFQDELWDFFYNIETGNFNYNKWANEISLIIESILKQNYIKYKYQSKSSSKPKLHKVLPVKMIYNSGTLYLYVYNLDETKDREYFLITIHRILPGTIESYELSEVSKFIELKMKQSTGFRGKSVPRFLSENIYNINIEEKRLFSFGLVWNEQNIQDIELEFKKQLIDQIRDREWHFSPDISYLEDGNLIMKMKLDINHELVNWLMARLPFVIIHKPQKLIDMVQERLDQFQKDHS